MSEQERMRIRREERVAELRRKLAAAEEELRWLNERPPGCLCDPLDWRGVPGPVCERFEPSTRTGLCRRCEHMKDCHEVKP